MKRLFLSVALMVITMGATAQSGGGGGIGKDFDLFDFSLNASRLEMGINLGQAGSFSDYARFAVGANLLYNGFYLDFILADPEHKHYSGITDTKWNDTCAFSLNFGYQIPIVDWLRVMPLIGYAQTNDGVTDGSSLHLSTGDTTTTWYHDYEVTPGSRKHYFNFGGGFSVQPWEWFSINLIVTRHAIYGGIGFNVLEFAMR